MCILCHVAMARRIYLDVSLTKCLYSFMYLCCIFIENENQVREGFLFIWQAFWLIIVLKCNIWLHDGLALTLSEHVLLKKKKKKHQWGLCTRPKKWLLDLLNVIGLGVGNVNLHYTSCQLKEKKWKKIPLSNEPQMSEYKTVGQNLT